MDAQVQEMLTINHRQRAYYETTNGSVPSTINSRVTNSWRWFRQRCFDVYPQANRDVAMSARHKQWLGDISQRRVLELGVGSGSPMSVWLAQNAKQYTAIDLSQPRIDELRAMLASHGVRDARLVAADFLSEDFDGDGYDIIYARAVMHHFRYVEPLLCELNRRMADGGVVVSFDPLQTWWPARAFRACYRPFQTDADWEHPFTHQTLAALESHFDVEAVQGYFGRSKWALPLAAVTPRQLAYRLAKACNARDEERCNSLARVRSCLQASFLLRKRAAPASSSFAA